MLRKIRVYGRLAKFLGKRVFDAEVASAAEAVRFLLANFPQLEKHMADQHYKVTVGQIPITADELHYPAGQQEIKIIPVVAGAGSQGLGIGQVLLGVALIAASIFVPGGAAIFGTTFGQISLGVGLLGGALALQGVATLLTPVPQPIATGSTGTDTAKDPRKSYSFSGIQNTARQGLPIPVIYGETVVGSITVSAGVDIAALKA